MALAELVERPEMAVRKSSRAGTKGLQSLFLDWRKSRPWLGDVLQAIWRPGVNKAKTRMDAHEASNKRKAQLITDTEKGKKNKKKAATAKGAPSGKKAKTAEVNWLERLPRRAQKAQRDPESLLTRRKKRERKNNHTLTISERIQRINGHALRIPGVGDVRVKQWIPANLKPRSCTFVERSNTERLLRGKKLRPEERLWSLHVQERIPAPLRRGANRPGSPSAGVDQGVAKPITLKDHQGRIRIFQPDSALTAGRQNRLTGLKKRKKGCVRGSRRWTKLGGKVRAAGKRIRNIKHEELRRFANTIASEYDLIGIEKLNNRGMRAAARGTHERHGENVAAKTGLNRSLDRVAPGRQTDEMKAACVRSGTAYVLVNPRNTSTTCAKCGHCGKRNRESQAVFRCLKCGYCTDADANAAENVRRLAEAAVLTHRADVDRSEAARGGGAQPRAPN